MNYNKGLMFVDQLERVVAVGTDKWKACCPAHNDRSPSLSIRQVDDGRVLLHCFAGCTVEDIVSSVGLSIGDLFPDVTDNYKQVYHKKAQLTVDNWVLEIAKSDRESGQKLSREDEKRELQAFNRLRSMR